LLALQKFGGTICISIYGRPLKLPVKNAAGVPDLFFVFIAKTIFQKNKISCDGFVAGEF